MWLCGELVSEWRESSQYRVSIIEDRSDCGAQVSCEVSAKVFADVTLVRSDDKKD